MIRAVEKGFYITVELFVQAGADVNAVSEYGSTALVTASQHISCKPNESVDHGKCIDFLIDEGADVNKNVCGNTAPANIVQFCRDDILKSLIEAGAHVNIARGRRGITPLIKAMEKNDTECVKLLINAEADVNAANKHGVTPLHIHNIGNDSSEHQCLNILLDKDDTDVNAVDDYGNSPLIYAAKCCNHGCLTTLHQAGADVNKTNNEGSTALNGAASASVKCIDVLLGAGADVNISNNGGMTPIMTAATSDNKECIQKLLDAGADLNAVLKNGNTVTFLPSFICLQD